MNKESAVGEISKKALLEFKMVNNEQEAEKLIAEKTAEEMLEYISSKGSVNAALKSLKKYIDQQNSIDKIPEDLFEKYAESIIKGEENDALIEDMMKYTTSLDEESLTLFMLNEIHDNWAIENKGKFDRKEKWFQFLPLEYLGWKEVEKDLIYAKPIIESLKKKVDPEKIKRRYFKDVNKYLRKNDIRNRKTLDIKLKDAIRKYEPLDEKQKETLLEKENYEELVEQVEEKGIMQDEVELKEMLGDQLYGEKKKLEELENEKEIGKYLEEQVKEQEKENIEKAKEDYKKKI